MTGSCAPSSPTRSRRRIRAAGATRWRLPAGRGRLRAGPPGRSRARVHRARHVPRSRRGPGPPARGRFRPFHLCVDAHACQRARPGGPALRGAGSADVRAALRHRRSSARSRRRRARELGRHGQPGRKQRRALRSRAGDRGTRHVRRQGRHRNQGRRFVLDALRRAAAAIWILPSRDCTTATTTAITSARRASKAGGARRHRQKSAQRSSSAAPAGRSSRSCNWPISGSSWMSSPMQCRASRR